MALRAFRGQDGAGAFTKAARGDQARRDQTGSCNQHFAIAGMHGFVGPVDSMVHGKSWNG